MTRIRTSYSIALIFLSLWLGWAVLVEFIVIPAVFRIVDTFFTAGNLGIEIFRKVNVLELLAAAVVVSATTLIFRNNKKSWPLLTLAVIALVLVLNNHFYLVPRLTVLTEDWSKTGLVAENFRHLLPEYQQEHQFFHKLYFGLAGLKLLLLLSLISLVLLRERHWS